MYPRFIYSMNKQRIWCTFISILVLSLTSQSGKHYFRVTHTFFRAKIVLFHPLILSLCLTVLQGNVPTDMKEHHSCHSTNILWITKRNKSGEFKSKKKLTCFTFQLWTIYHKLLKFPKSPNNHGLTCVVIAIWCDLIILVLLFIGSDLLWIDNNPII